MSRTEPTRLKADPRYQGAFAAERRAWPKGHGALRERVMKAAESPPPAWPTWAAPGVLGGAVLALALAARVASVLAPAGPTLSQTAPSPNQRSEPLAAISGESEQEDAPATGGSSDAADEGLVPVGPPAPGPLEPSRSGPVRARLEAPASVQTPRPAQRGATAAGERGPKADGAASEPTPGTELERSRPDEEMQTEPPASLAPAALGGKARETNLDDLSSDLAAYERARERVDSGALEGAKEALFAYLETRPHGRFRLEARLDLVSLLVRLGDQPAALDVALELLDAPEAASRRSELLQRVVELEAATGACASARARAEREGLDSTIPGCPL